MAESGNGLNLRLDAGDGKETDMAVSSKQAVLFSNQPEISTASQAFAKLGFRHGVAPDADTAVALLRADQVGLLFCDATISSTCIRTLLDEFDKQVFQPPLVLTFSDRLANLTAGCLRRSVWDLVPASCTSQELEETIRFADIESKRRIRDRQHLERFAESYGSLSSDESAVLRAVCEGKLNKQIAREMNVSIRTVEQRRSRMFEKMQSSSAAPLALRVATAQAIQRQYPKFQLGLPSFTPEAATTTDAVLLSLPAAVPVATSLMT